MSAQDGGPAFPIWQEDMNLGDTAGPGMTLRDYFAAAALGAMSAEIKRNAEFGFSMKDLASKAFVIADAMIAHRAALTKAGTT